MVLSVSNVLFNMIAQHKTRIRMDPQRYVYMCCSLQRRRAASSIGSLIYQPQHLSLSGLCWSFYCWRTYYDLTYRHSSSIQSLFIHHLIPVKSFLSCFLCFLFSAKNITNGIHTNFSLHSGWIYLPRRPCAHMCLHVVRIEIEHGLACTFYTHTQQCVCARRVYYLTCSRQDIYRGRWRRLYLE